MPTTVSSAVLACNELTGRWCVEQPADRDFVVSGAGLWPLLALLSSAAAGPARAELSAVTAIPAECAQRDALEIIDTMDRAVAAAAALGLWLRPGMEIADAKWAAALPAGVVGTLTGQTQLDSWAAEHTAGLIERLPLQIEPRSALVLTTALGVKTRWRQVFSPVPRMPKAGPWRGRRLEFLQRTTTDPGAVSLLPGPVPVTRAVVEGADDIDVHLLLGAPDAAAGPVITAGLAALGRSADARSAAELPVGFSDTGIQVAEFQGTHDEVRMTVPPFTIRSSHDLCSPPERFGLRTAMDPEADAFPALYPQLSVGQGAQDVQATFSWKGFEAAAVTAFAMRAAAMMLPRDRRARRIELTLDRPFGFAAVHRSTGLAIVAGWVAEAR